MLRAKLLPRQFPGMIPDRLLKLAGTGAMGVSAGAFAAYVLLVLAFRPTPTSGMPGNGGGIDAVCWAIFAFAAFVPIFLLAWWHVDFGRQLKAGRNSCPGVR